MKRSQSRLPYRPSITTHTTFTSLLSVPHFEDFTVSSRIIVYSLISGTVAHGSWYASFRGMIQVLQLNASNVSSSQVWRLHAWCYKSLTSARNCPAQPLPKILSSSQCRDCPFFQNTHPMHQ
jgi:hypothetical protein